MNRPRAAYGFTLIEVLVALAIVAIGMSAVLSALSSSANTVVYLRDKTFAQWVGLNKIATIRISGQQPARGVTNGDTDFAGRSWHWRQEVFTTDVPGLVRMEVSVRPKDAKGDDDSGWTTTIIGISGNSVGIPDAGATPSWASQSINAPLQKSGGTQTPTGTATGTTTDTGTLTGTGTSTGTGTPTTPGRPTPGTEK